MAHAGRVHGVKRVSTELLQTAITRMRVDAERCGDAPTDFIPTVADLLESSRCSLHCGDDGMRDPYCSACEDSTCDHECPPPEVCKHSVSYRRALAAAQAYLGENR